MRLLTLLFVALLATSCIQDSAPPTPTSTPYPIPTKEVVHIVVTATPVAVPASLVDEPIGLGVSPRIIRAMFEEMGFVFKTIDNDRNGLPRVMGETDYAGVFLVGTLDLIEATLLFSVREERDKVSLTIAMFTVAIDPTLGEDGLGWMWDALIAGEEKVSKAHGSIHLYAARITDDLTMLHIRPKYSQMQR